MNELVEGVNWLAVGISTFLCFALGALWYSPVMFGVKWAEGVGVPIGEDAKQPVAALLLQFLGTLLFAWLVSLTLASGAFLLAALIAVAISVLLSAGGLFGGNSRYAATVEGVFVIVMFLIMLLCNIVL